MMWVIPRENRYLECGHVMMANRRRKYCPECAAEAERKRSAARYQQKKLKAAHG